MRSGRARRGARHLEIQMHRLDPRRKITRGETTGGGCSRRFRSKLLRKVEQPNGEDCDGGSSPSVGCHDPLFVDESNTRKEPPEYNRNDGSTCSDANGEEERVPVGHGTGSHVKKLCQRRRRQKRDGIVRDWRVKLAEPGDRLGQVAGRVSRVGHCSPSAGFGLQRLLS